MQYLHYCILHKIQLKCKNCFLKFHTDRGLEIHMLGVHGKVTNGMREAARKGKDGGRCPICKQVRLFFSFLFYFLFIYFAPNSGFYIEIT